jgi:hypothetical protein
MPNLIMDLIGGMLSKDPELDVVARLAEGESLRTAVQRYQADVLIIGQREAIPMDMLPAEAFSCSPAKLVTIGHTAKDGMVWVLRPDGTPINELSPDTLTAVARETRSI